MTFSHIYLISGVRRLPVDPVEIARSLDIKVIGYKAASELFDVEPCDLYSRCPLGFSFKESGSCCIALNENACSEQRRRFTAAHELAHCVLGHLGSGAPTKLQEREAERFAAELLAPLAVVRNCAIRSAEELAQLCGISKAAASNRLYELAERERLGFCESEDEHRIAEIFQEFTKSYASKAERKDIDKIDRYPFIKSV